MSVIKTEAVRLVLAGYLMRQTQEHRHSTEPSIQALFLKQADALLEAVGAIDAAILDPADVERVCGWAERGFGFGSEDNFKEKNQRVINAVRRAHGLETT